MQAIPEIPESKIAPFNGSFIAAPIKKPTVPATTIIITDTAVLNFCINNLPPTKFLIYITDVIS